MAVTLYDYLEYIKHNERVPIYKFDFLRKTDETIYKSYTGSIINDSGSISITLDEGVRRTCNFSLPNYDNEFTQTIAGLTLGARFKLSLGYKINDEDLYFPQGVFIFDNPKLISNLAEKKVEIAGTDKWSMLNGQNGGVLEGTYTVPAGTPIGKLIRSILALDIVGDPIEPMIDTTLENTQITYDITKDAGETVSDILLEVALNCSCYIYYDEVGRLQVYPEQNDIHKGVAYSFNPTEYNYLTSTKEYKLSDVYNSVLVVGDDIDSSSVPIVYEALNNDPSDPNSIVNIGFKKVKVINEYTKGITTQELAVARANWELRKARTQLSSVSIECLSLYHLDVNQIITLTDDYINSNEERYVINSIDLPIGVDIKATIELTKAVNEY